MGLAAGTSLDPGTAVATLTGGVLSIGASGTFNNVLERDVDRHMDRTADRPVVQGADFTSSGHRVRSPARGCICRCVRRVRQRPRSRARAARNPVLQRGVHPRAETAYPQNIVIGGVVGAFPALIGWAAVENTVGMPAIILGTVIFLWTPARFYNLALAYREDYAAAGFPMLPVVRGGGNDSTAHPSVPRGDATRGGRTRRHNPTRLAVCRHYRPGRRGVSVGNRSTVPRTHRTGRIRTFHASNAYLGGLLIAILVDTLLV